MNHLARSVLVVAVLLAGAAPTWAQEGSPMAMTGGLKISPDGNDMADDPSKGYS